MTIANISLMNTRYSHKANIVCLVEELLAQADIYINGTRPWDIQVHDDRFFNRIIEQANLGLGESYMDTWWDCSCLDAFFYRVLRSQLHKQVGGFGDKLAILRAKLINLQCPSRAFQVAEHHYDIGNDLYQCMLDQRMIYSCGYWNNAKNLDEAQEAKLKLVCQKLQLESGMKVLDIGCGWGGSAKYLAENYDVQVIGITVSRQQADVAKEICKGLPVEIRLQDYRDVNEFFDRVFSIGMFEHVGVRNYSTYMAKVHSLLPHDGLFLLHTIGGNSSVNKADRWIDRYIFPNSMLPSASQITKAYEGLFVLEDWHSFGSDYDQTLLSWKRNFESAWCKIKNNYSERFRRMWSYYLLSNAGAFRAREFQLWQILLSPNGFIGGIRVPH
jgi:cyclopropane-fatty-acyl-phospholipid synthase